MPTVTPIPSDAKTFEDGVLRKIGAPVNLATETAFTWWLANEQGGPSLSSFENNKGNPLGVQTPEAQAAGRSGNLQAGIDQTANLLVSSPNYKNVVAAFRQGTNATAIAAAIVASPWNGSHYGGFNTFLSTAGQARIPGDNQFLGGALSGNGTATYAAALQAQPATASGCGAKTGSNPGEPNQIFTIPHTSTGLTYCELKGILGGLSLAAGATIIVIGMATLIVGGLGGKAGPAAAVVAGVTPLGKAATAVTRVARRPAKKVPAKKAA